MRPTASAAATRTVPPPFRQADFTVHPLAMTITPQTDNLDALIATAETVLIGKRHALKLAVTCLLANGHLLINDLPGVGKTTLAHLLARLFGFEFSRIQFTSDLLPADITGVTVYRQQDADFAFHRGPIFAQMVLADEINRASPKTQSALLEAMEERQVSVENQTHALPQPFFVVATQNPAEQVGTYPLPESQLDRFMLSIELGYPDAAAEKTLLLNGDPRRRLAQLPRCVTAPAFAKWQAAVEAVHTSDALIAYLQLITAFTRTAAAFAVGYSPRAALALLRAAKAWALLAGRAQALPEDIQAILPSTMHHLRLREPTTNIADLIINSVAIP